MSPSKFARGRKNFFAAVASLLNPLRAARYAAAAALLCAATAAPAWSFPWSIDMYRGPALQPLEVSPRVMPPGTLPVDTGEPPMSLEMMTVRMHNTLQPTPENLAHGEKLYYDNCAPCHGDSGTGNGTVAHLLHYPPYNLMNSVARELPDGFIYGYIRDGGTHMPAYYDAMNSDERWDVVMYVRQLQKQTPNPPVASSASPTSPAQIMR